MLSTRSMQSIKATWGHMAPTRNIKHRRQRLISKSSSCACVGVVDGDDSDDMYLCVYSNVSNICKFTVVLKARIGSHDMSCRFGNNKFENCIFADAVDALLQKLVNLQPCSKRNRAKTCQGLEQIICLLTHGMIAKLR